jgi:hypothetical protein
MSLEEVPEVNKQECNCQMSLEEATDKNVIPFDRTLKHHNKAHHH